MRTRAKVAGDAVHPMLVVLPLGLFGISVVFDVLGLLTGQPPWARLASWNIGAGIVAAIVAGAFGLADLRVIPSGTRAARVGLAHGLLNVAVTGLFGVSLVLRALTPEPSPPTLALGLSIAALALALIAGRLGGELMDRLGAPLHAGAAHHRR